jgi:hypothetical protein
MPSTKLVQVVSQYPPQVGGISDYAAKLAQAFETSGQPLHTIVTSDRCTPDSSKKVTVLRSATGSELLRAIEQLEATAVLLHFSGYGFARWGLCYWLVEGLRAWKQGGTNRKCVIIFHEVYATGPIWRASFWTSFPQKQIATDLAQLSDAAFVTSQGGYAQLKPLHSDLSLEILPVFSNVGEPPEMLPLSSRDGIAVVFGGAGRRDRAYKSLAKQTDDLVAGFTQLGITEIIDIGPGNSAPKNVADFPVCALDLLSEEVISGWLQRTRLGVADYPLDKITKSGILAAYFAHGLLTVNTSCIGRLPDDLVEGREFINLQRFNKGGFDAQSVASSGFTWYQSHRLSTATKRLIHKLSI